MNKEKEKENVLFD